MVVAYDNVALMKYDASCAVLTACLLQRACCAAYRRACSHELQRMLVLCHRLCTFATSCFLMRVLCFVIVFATVIKTGLMVYNVLLLVLKVIYQYWQCLLQRLIRSWTRI